MSDRPWLGIDEAPSEPRSFALDMTALVARSLVGRFGENLWGVAIEPDHERRRVEVTFHFEAEPSALDRFEMGEFYVRFESETAGRVTYRHRRRVGPRSAPAGGPPNGRVWVHLTRDPAAVAPDDAEPEELDY